MLADTNAIYFPYQTSHLVGTYYLADTDQPAPFALFLHGIPGSEKNHDLAQKLRASGWHVLVLHFAGVWGSGGTYNIPSQVEQAHAALEFALAYPRPIRQEKIAVVGFSLGSRMAIMSALTDARIGAVVSLAGFSDFSDTLFQAEFFEGIVPLLSGITAQEVAQQFTHLGDGLQPHEVVQKLAPRPVLAIHGTADEIVPYFHLNGFQGEHITTVSIEGANHTFAAHRDPLVTVTHDFLMTWLAGN